MNLAFTKELAADLLMPAARGWAERRPLAGSPARVTQASDPRFPREIPPMHCIGKTPERNVT